MQGQLFTLLMLLFAACNIAKCNDIIVATDKYTWKGDTIYQDEFIAYAPSDTQIFSTYKAQPGYFMPIGSEWQLKNDISSYPKLVTDNKLHAAIYNMGLDEMVNNIEPDSTLRTGKEWSGVWTRDVSYSIILSLAEMLPEQSMVSLLKKITPDGRIVQDTGTGGAWPVSSDRMIWIIAAWEVYKATGDKEWIKKIFPVVEKSLADDYKTVIASNNLVNGETSFIDWREQSYPRWMQSADIFASQALGTSVVEMQALVVASEMAELLGYNAIAEEYIDRACSIKKAIDTELWLPGKGYHAMYKYGRLYPIANPRAETLGESLAILFDAVTEEKAAEITQNLPVTDFGAPVFSPQISDMRPYHNNALWPFVASYWALANAKAGNETGLLEAIGSVYRPVAMFATNKENLVLDNGDIATELNSSNMLWSLAGNIAITNRILFGINLTPKGIEFRPVIPEALAANRMLMNYTYRGKILDITIDGWGNKIKHISLNGEPLTRPFIDEAMLKERNTVKIEMDNLPFQKMDVNRGKNVKAPLTPIAWIDDNGSLLRWNPIEYIDKYIIVKDGKRITETTQTSFPLTDPGEYIVIGVNNDGVESFGSEPRNNFSSVKYQMPHENLEIQSDEVRNKPHKVVQGYNGNGFIEADHSIPHIEIPVDISDNGTYAVALRYANGNGPVNTENKCAIRSLLVDNKKEGVFVMPQRGVGNWNDWGSSNSIIVTLSKGRHVLDIAFLPENENMNITTNHALIDELILTRIN